MKGYYFDLILLVSLAGILILYEANRFMKKEKNLMKMSYDNRRFLIGLILVPSILSKIRNFNEQLEYANLFKSEGLMTIDRFTAFSRYIYHYHYITTCNYVYYDYRLSNIWSNK